LIRKKRCETVRRIPVIRKGTGPAPSVHQAKEEKPGDRRKVGGGKGGRWNEENSAVAMEKKKLSTSGEV